jgi:hypothetical protein
MPDDRSQARQQEEEEERSHFSQSKQQQLTVRYPNRFEGFTAISKRWFLGVLRIYIYFFRRDLGKYSVAKVQLRSSKERSHKRSNRVPSGLWRHRIA